LLRIKAGVARPPRTTKLVREANEMAKEMGGGYTDRQRDWIWANRPALIGGQLEFAYQKDTVAVARFPRFVRFRWDRARDPMAATFPV
jgi:hypothetical protein